MSKDKHTARKRDPQTLEILAEAGLDEATLKARSVLRPTVQAAETLRHCNNQAFPDLDLMSLINALSKQTDAVIEGDMGRAEAMLTSQAQTLDALFNTLARRSIANMGHYQDTADRYMRLALKAQSQCRTTWEAVSVIKHPPVVIAKQTNISGGHQQVNNGIPAHAESQNQQNELLEQTDGKRLDTGAACTAGRADPAMATVGEIDRAEDSSR